MTMLNLVTIHTSENERAVTHLQQQQYRMLIDVDDPIGNHWAALSLGRGGVTSVDVKFAQFHNFFAQITIAAFRATQISGKH
eukprot:m.58693 g.58693  ORF g.58693 m.58693 type:complete len:82 (-) comp9423_c0_seq1:768-1013(-)